MIEELYEQYTELLAGMARDDERLRDTITRYAEGGSKPSKAIAARFIGAFRTYLFGGREKRVLMDAGGGLRVYNGRWHEQVPMAKLFLKELSRRVLERLGAGPVHQEFTSGMIGSGLYDSLMATDIHTFKPDRRYIAMNNGVLDLNGRGGCMLKDFSATIQTDIVLDFDYIDPKGARIVKIVGEENSQLYALWERKLGEIMPAKELQDCFQEFCGSILCDRTDYRSEYFCILEGPGSNGKSVLVNAIAGVFDESLIGRYSLEQFFKGERKDRFIADMAGKIMNIADDISARGFDPADFKKAMAPDGIQGMKAYATDPSKIKMPPIAGCCNAMPDVKDNSWGYFRRILRLGTGQTFSDRSRIKRDPRLLATLRKNPCRLAILHWMLEGRKRFLKNNGDIVIPEEVREAVKTQMEESSPYRLWLRDCGYARADEVTEQNGRWIPIATLYEEYTQYCKEAGYMQKDIGIRNSLSSFLKGAGYRPHKFNQRQGNTNYFMYKL